VAAELAIEDCLPVRADRFDEEVLKGLGVLVANIELAAALGLAQMDPIASEALPQTDQTRFEAARSVSRSSAGAGRRSALGRPRPLPSNPRIKSDEA